MREETATKSTDNPRKINYATGKNQLCQKSSCRITKFWGIFANNPKKRGLLVWNMSKNFEHNFMLFIEQCRQADIPKQDRTRELTIVSCCSTLQFYFENIGKNIDLVAHAKWVKNIFQPPKRTSAFFWEWGALIWDGWHIKAEKSWNQQASKFWLQSWRISKQKLQLKICDDPILSGKHLNAVLSLTCMHHFRPKKPCLLATSPHLLVPSVQSL